MRVRLEIINDGTGPPPSCFVYSLCDGSIGIAERARGIERCADPVHGSRTITDKCSYLGGNLPSTSLSSLIMFLSREIRFWNRGTNFWQFKKITASLCNYRERKPAIQQREEPLLKPISWCELRPNISFSFSLAN